MSNQDKGVPLLYRESCELPDRDVDAFGCLKPASAALLMQHLAEAHAACYGNSRSDLLKTGAVWVLARTKAKFSRLPRAHETLDMQTWPGKMVRNLFPRYYSFSQNGQEIGAAVTLWMLVDTTAHQPALPEKHGVFITGDPAYPAPFDHPVRIRESGEPLFSIHRRCAYSDLDENAHMNNARYLEWMCDALSPASTPVGFQVNYLAEILPNEEVTLNVYDGCVFVGFKAGGTRAFEGKLEF
ncbi:MAG: acyl-[acyl-carrier-protein] thioesterase [Christensenellales bacterium]|jgi:medium-chain acyl-[acyl-carrier-protein] hydrolase